MHGPTVNTLPKPLPREGRGLFTYSDAVLTGNSSWSLGPFPSRKADLQLASRPCENAAKPTLPSWPTVSH